MRALGCAAVLAGGLAVAIGVSAAMQPTCAACSDYCCQWAFAARLEQGFRPHPWSPPNPHTQGAWERRGYPAPPCKELLADREAYQRCATKAFRRCRKSPRCRGCARGQSTVIRKKRP